MTSDSAFGWAGCPELRSHRSTLGYQPPAVTRFNRTKIHCASGRDVNPESHGYRSTQIGAVSRAVIAALGKRGLESLAQQGGETDVCRFHDRVVKPCTNPIPEDSSGIAAAPRRIATGASIAAWATSTGRWCFG